jgi:hypothetical protein
MSCPVKGEERRWGVPPTPTAQPVHSRTDTRTHTLAGSRSASQRQHSSDRVICGWRAQRLPNSQ